MENKRLKLTTYTAGSIESASNKEMKEWRKEIIEKLASPDLGIYDPVEQESNKVGKESKEQILYITGLKQSGNWCLHETTLMFWKMNNEYMRGELKDLYKLFLLNNKLDLIIKLPTLDLKGNCCWVKIKNIIPQKSLYNKKIVLTNGQEIISTNEHKFPVILTYRTGKTNTYLHSPNIKKAKELKVKDCLYYLHKFDIESNSNYDYIDGFAIGFYLAEGNKCKDSNTFNITLSCGINKDEKYLDIIKKKFNIYTRPDKKRLTVLRANSWDNNYRKLINDFTRGTTSYDKCLTNMAFNQSVDFLRGILEGFLCGDGSLTANNSWNVNITSKNKKLRNDLLIISKILGKQIRLFKNHKGNNYSNTEMQSFCINDKYSNRKKINDTIYIPIERIENYNKTSLFFDIEVEPIWINTWSTRRNIFTSKYSKRNSSVNNLFTVGNGIITHNSKFSEEMQKIWWGKIDVKKLDKIRLLIYLYEKARLEGNYLTDFPHWADYEAVVRSNFIIAYMPKDVKTIGTILEMHICYLFNIPIYLILPDQSKTEANSTLIDMVINSGGEIFYNINSCVDFIRDKYKIKEEEKK